MSGPVDKDAAPQPAPRLARTTQHDESARARKRERDRRYRLENPEEFAAQRRRWVEANRDRIRESNRRWREEHLERARELNRDSMRADLKFYQTEGLIETPLAIENTIDDGFLSAALKQLGIDRRRH